MISQSTKLSAIVRSLLFSSPNFKIHPSKDSEAVPTGPETPKRVRATSVTASSMMSLGIKICVSLYVSNVEQGEGGGCENVLLT